MQIKIWYLMQDVLQKRAVTMISYSRVVCFTRWSTRWMNHKRKKPLSLWRRLTWFPWLRSVVGTPPRAT